MTATSLFFDGKLIFKPGSYSKVDASQLATQGLGANGHVAVIGTAVGGTPASAITRPVDHIAFTRPGKEGTVFRSGDLLEAVPMLFEPSNDPDILGGAQRITCLKVNQDTQSTITTANGDGDSIVFTSVDYGAHTAQISLEIADGTNQGKQVIVTLEDVIQMGDNIGGDAMFTIQYAPPSGASGTGWTDMTADVLAGGQMRANGTFGPSAGLVGDAASHIQSTARVASSDADDVGQIVTVYGLVSGVATREQVTLNGTTPVATTALFDADGIKACIVDTAHDGTITVKDSGATTALSMATGVYQKGCVKCGAFSVAGQALTFVCSGSSTANVWFVGRTTTGAVVTERHALNNTTPVVTTATTWANMEAIVLVEVATDRTVTVTGKAVQTVAATQNTLQKVADFFNARQLISGSDVYGFTFTLGTFQTTYAVSKLDLVTATDVDYPATGSFLADLDAIISFVNTHMDLVTAEAAEDAVGVPDNTGGAVFLSGGSDGSATFGDYQAALNQLKLLKVNTIVCLTSDPAVHAALKAHCNFMCGIGRSERDGVVGLKNDDQDGLATKAQIKSQVLSLNSRHLRAVAQSVDRYDSAGELTTFGPQFTACLVAGMQAGTTVGEPLTYKQVNCVAFQQHSGWNSVEDAEEMIQLGLMFMEEVDGIGRRWVRNITTNVGSSNIAFTEASVNQAVNFAVYNFRTNMEVSVGRKGFSGTINAAKAIAIGTLGALVGAEVLTLYRNLGIELVLDVLEVTVEIAPVIPINFVRTVLHLVAVRQTAA